MVVIMNSVTLLPADIYQVVNKSLLNESDKLVLNMLYMPIHFIIHFIMNLRLIIMLVQN